MSSDDDIDKMTHENAMKLYHFAPFQHVPKDQATVGALRKAAEGHDVSIKAPVATSAPVIRQVSATSRRRRPRCPVLSKSEPPVDGAFITGVVIHSVGEQRCLHTALRARAESSIEIANTLVVPGHIHPVR